MSKYVITVPESVVSEILETLKSIKGVKIEKQKGTGEKDWIRPSNRKKATPKEIEERIKSALRSKNVRADTVRKNLDSAIKKARAKGKAA